MVKIVDWGTGKKVKRGSGDNGFILPRGSGKVIRIKNGKRVMTAKDFRQAKKAARKAKKNSA